MSNQNSMGGGARHLSFGVPDGADSYSKVGGVSVVANQAYTILATGGWLLYTRFHSCRAYLRVADGWTQEQVEVMARVIDGEVIL